MQTKDDNQQHNDSPREDNSAADLIRQKIDALYNEEPNAKEEIAEVKAKPDDSLSKHQRHMKDLSESGRSLAEIQTAWHEYYTQLSDKEKHEVWQEFYSEHQKAREGKKPSHHSDAKPRKQEPQPTQPVTPISHNTAQLRKRPGKTTRARATVASGTTTDIRRHLISQVQGRAKITKNPHARALVFGLGMGGLTLFIMMFSFFNERLVTPFIRPNANVSATPIIVDPNASTTVDDPSSKIIIPKINVEAPIVFDVPTIQEKDVQKGLENGVVHYVTTPNPGEKGNSVIFGHSSSNILNKGKYKFAFLMLKSLEPGDTFIVQKDRKRYVYKVYNEQVVSPTDFSVIGPTDKPATMTLITCDPPGTSTNRLIIQAEQIFPDPSGNAASSVNQTDQPQQLPSNSVSLWQRIKNWF
jgi:LPXTG-site transpeptidase (sortase) family protein